MKKRTNVPQRVADAVLADNNHTCCICNEPRKHVVFHHIDSDPSNHDPANLAVVCHDCHSRVTGDEGLGRAYSSREVAKYKKRWEEQCAEACQVSEEEGPDEPICFVRETTRIKAAEHYLHDFEMEEGDELVVSVTADDYIDVSICSPSDYRRWVNSRGKDIRGYDGAEDVRECGRSFTAPRSGIYNLILINKNDDDVEVGVDAAVWSDEE
ncbi:MAG TPA: HNH endonuclease signature motif containing protein [Candidatus Udaeobacter sp.]|nr:HNH endonuclease signature motif containing protein [Candidatus Udaeobacter sp.]